MAGKILAMPVRTSFRPPTLMHVDVIAPIHTSSPVMLSSPAPAPSLAPIVTTGVQPVSTATPPPASSPAASGPSLAPIFATPVHHEDDSTPLPEPEPVRSSTLVRVSTPVHDAAQAGEVRSNGTVSTGLVWLGAAVGVGVAGTLAVMAMRKKKR